MPRLSINKAARLCGCARSTLQRAVTSGRLPRGSDRLVDTRDLIRLGYLDPAHEDDDVSTQPRMTVRQLYDALVPLLTLISQQLGELLTVLRPGAGQPPSESENGPPQRPLCPC